MAVKGKIILKKYKWTSFKSVHVAGFIWVNDQYLSGKSFAEFIKGKSSSFDDFKLIAKVINGQFSVIVENEEEIWAVSGHTWSYPVFYCRSNDEVIISDDPEGLLKQIPNPKPDNFSRNYFLLFGVTPGAKTLVEQISQIQPGEILVLKSSEKKSISIFNEYGKTSFQKVSENELYQLILSVFEKYYNYLKDKHILLPLTSGYDSRLLACLLKKFGHEKVLCAMWGRKNNSEKEAAEKVAKQLGFKFGFIDYSKEVASGFTSQPDFYDYIHFAGHLSSMPYLQDYFAVKALKIKQLIGEETIVLPGHPGDFLRGSHLDTGMETAIDSYLVSKIIDKFSSSVPLNLKLLNEVENFIVKHFLYDPDLKPWQKFEKWDFQDRQCKFISNSNQVYLFSGQQVMMPLFDKQFLEFFSRVPLKQKLGANYYFSTLENKFFLPYGVNFNLRSKVQHDQDHAYLKKLILKISPRFVKNIYYPLNDNIYYREITNELRISNRSFKYKYPRKPHFYNSYIIQWYLQLIEEIYLHGN